MQKIKIALRAIIILKNWSFYFKDYFGLVRGERGVYVLRNGLTFAVRPRTTDRVMFNQVWLDNVYFPEGFSIEETDTVVDIGAHIGFFSVLAASYAKKGMVYALEPTPGTFRLLEENVRNNKMRNVRLTNKAVSVDGKSRQFILYSKNPSANSFAYIGVPKNTIEVKTTTLKSFIEANNIQKIDFLKMDCEGAEYEVLFNCPSDILKKIKKIAMEYHDVDERWNKDTLRLFLEKEGFNVFIKTSGDSMLYATR